MAYSSTKKSTILKHVQLPSTGLLSLHFTQKPIATDALQATQKQNTSAAAPAPRRPTPKVKPLRLNQNYHFSNLYVVHPMNLRMLQLALSPQNQAEATTLFSSSVMLDLERPIFSRQSDTQFRPITPMQKSSTSHLKASLMRSLTPFLTASLRNFDVNTEKKPMFF